LEHNFLKLFIYHISGHPYFAAEKNSTDQGFRDMFGFGLEIAEKKFKEGIKIQ
jgi:hypothetical protein